MALPDFTDFLASIDWEEAEKIAQALTVGRPDILVFDKTNKASLGAALHSVGANAIAQANANTLALLTLYHRWLQDQFSI
ncbi:MAG: hypothetical protein HFF04_00940 [Oscillospiraceae bacterium]|nr:hypothetical protein [Oscillospiraceae bacterium]